MGRNEVPGAPLEHGAPTELSTAHRTLVCLEDSRVGFVIEGFDSGRDVCRRGHLHSTPNPTTMAATVSISLTVMQAAVIRPAIRSGLALLMGVEDKYVTEDRLRDPFWANRA